MKCKIAIVVIIVIGSVQLNICNAQKNFIAQLDFQKDLFPEGIAIDAQRKSLFLNSLKYDKIVSCNIDGSNTSNFIKNGQYGYLSGFGMTVKGDTLYALGNELKKAANASILLLLDSRTGKLIDTYDFKSSNLTYFNDLTISTNNEIFITDSESNKIYRIQRPNKEIKVFLDIDGIAHPNGIAISPNNKLLYLATQKGIRIVDTETKKLVNSSNRENLGVDGLKYYKNSLIGIVNIWESKPENNGIFQYFLDKTGKRILHKKKLLSFSKEFKVPTTFDLIGNKLYFIMNTQLDNFSETNKKTLNKSILEPLQLIEINIPKNQ
ncbi:hypothetical protein HME9304_02017 [Flagellimonas maritima]|uniref:SMP-30/Gluconolactonase/LRE-like region domain-containing protein n=1 Tax=Flagellimonas maritima TaxID=1383885 RepID=A0A2Z4LTF7_9FLAO|nr:SMP-30/gluconolactonase/LRE family protein [Allomuricauda aurantiaca]AWX45009.1 hypothetical protein HME9304_02017 [Allomuricauda aurantiaca]